MRRVFFSEISQEHPHTLALRFQQNLKISLSIAAATKGKTQEGKRLRLASHQMRTTIGESSKFDQFRFVRLQL